MATAPQLAEREHEYLTEKTGADFFLQIGAYLSALNRNRALRKIIQDLEAEVTQAVAVYAREEAGFVEEAIRIRTALAQRAPEVDNSDAEPPDPGSHRWAHYDFESFARFDQLAAADEHARIGFLPLPRRDCDAPGVIGQLLIILRGRHRCAVYGYDTTSDIPQAAMPQRSDLEDLARDISNLAERYEHTARRWRQQSRTLPGLGPLRLRYFGSDLNPRPIIVESAKDDERLIAEGLRAWSQPKPRVQRLVDGAPLESWEIDWLRDVETRLKTEAERLHQELIRRTPSEPWWRSAAKVALPIAVTVASALILHYGFGLG